MPLSSSSILAAILTVAFYSAISYCLENDLRALNQGLVLDSHVDSAHETLNVSAVLNAPSPPYHAVIECWAFSAAFQVYPTVGKALSLGDTSRATYVVLPPRSGEGWHRPPADMYFILLSGAAHVHVPAPSPDSGSLQGQATANEHLYIKPGQNQLIIAIDSDRRSPGHLTYYPGDSETVALQVPFRGGKLPKHRFIKHGACEGPTEPVKGRWWADELGLPRPRE